MKNRFKSYESDVLGTIKKFRCKFFIFFFNYRRGMKLFNSADIRHFFLFSIQYI